jgi:hypothetical protein
MKEKFDFYDYFIFCVILIFSICIGLYFGLNLDQKFKNIWNNFKLKWSKNSIKPNEIELNDLNESEGKTMEYLTANHSMGAFPIALSLLSTFFSSSSLLGFPAEVYQYGIQYWIIVFGVCLVPLGGGLSTASFKFVYLIFLIINRNSHLKLS